MADKEKRSVVEGDNSLMSRVSFCSFCLQYELNEFVNLKELSLVIVGCPFEAIGPKKNCCTEK